MGLLYNILIRLVNFLVFFFIIILVPGLPPYNTHNFTSFQVTKPRDLTGPLELNNWLDNAERLLEDRIYGPEHLLANSKGEIFTGIHGGEIIKINGDHITHVAKFGQPCEATYEEAKCGRPLGMAMDTLGNNLVVADAYSGIWLVNLDNNKKQVLVPAILVLGEAKTARPAKIFNSVAVAKNGDIYWTDSSSDTTLNDGIYTMLANPSGRLFYYSRAKNTSTVLVDEIYFANGLALSPNEDFVVVSETHAGQLRKYYLTGPNKGKNEVFVDGLPGSPDNLTPDAEGIWVPLVIAADKEKDPSISAMLSRVPNVRLFLARMLSLAEMPFKVADKYFPNVFCKRVQHFIGNFESMKGLFSTRQTVLRVDWTGKIVGSLHGFDGSVKMVSHVLEAGDYLYLGSPFNRYMGRVKLPKIPKLKVNNVRYEPVVQETAPPTTTAAPVTERPTTTTQKPTATTTQKPVTTTAAPVTTQRPATTTTQAPTTRATTTQAPTTQAPTTRATTTQAPTTQAPTTQAPTTQAPTTQTPTTQAPTTQAPTTTTTTQAPTTTTQKPVTTTAAPAPTKAATPKPTTTAKPVTTTPAAVSEEVVEDEEIEPITPDMFEEAFASDEVIILTNKNKKASSTPTEVPRQNAPKDPAPIYEEDPQDTPLPTPPPKMKVILKGGEQGEL